MAMVSKPTATFTYTIKDASGSTSPMQVHIPEGTLKEAALLGMNTLRPLIEAMTDGTIIAQSLTYSFAENAPAAPVAGSRVEEKGTFIFNTDNGRTTQFNIPAIKDTMLTASGSINRADVGVAALVTAVTGVDSIFCGADGSDIATLKSAYQKFRSTTKTQLPSDR